MKNKENTLLIKEYKKILNEMSSEDTNPDRNASPTYVPMGLPDKDFKKYPVEPPPEQTDPYIQLKQDIIWLKKHCKNFKNLAGERLHTIAYNLEDLYNELTRGY